MTIVQEVLPGFVGEVELLYKGVSAMRRWKEWRKKEDGVTIVIVALSLTAILSMTALVIDLGLAFYHRAHLQAACDAAALAAAWDINGQPTTEGEACFFQNYSEEEKNSYSVENYKYEINISAGTVDTWGRMRSPTAFAKIFGVDYIEVGAYAQAINAEIPSPNSPWNITLVTDGPIKLNSSGTVSSAHSNDYIHVGYNIDVIDSITAGNRIEAGSGNSFIHPGNSDTPPEIQSGPGVKNYDIEVGAKEMRDKLGLSGTAPYYNTNGWPTWNLNDGNWEAIDTSRPKLVNEARYTGDKSFDACDINANLFVNGNLSINAGTCKIAEGVTVYVTGNLNVNSGGFVCNGNLIVLGNISNGGQGFACTSSTDNYIYCEGDSVQLGTASQDCTNLFICAPKCKTFNIDGGGCKITGSIVAKASTEFNCSNFEMIYPGDGHSPASMVRTYRLSK